MKKISTKGESGEKKKKDTTKEQATTEVDIYPTLQQEDTSQNIRRNASFCWQTVFLPEADQEVTNSD